MASIRERIDSKGCKTYHVQVRLKGFPPQTKTFESKTLARQWAAYVETELRAGRYMPQAQAQRHTVRELLEAYREKILKTLKPQELRTQGPQLDWWIQKLGAYSLADVSPAAIAKCRDELLQTPVGKTKKRLRKPATAIRYMAVLSHAFSVAVREWQWMAESPMPKVVKPKVSNSRMRYLSKDEQARLLDAARQSANRYLHTILKIALATGMRYGEIINLRWKDLLLSEDDKFGLVVLQTTKNGEPRGIPLVGEACGAIKVLQSEYLKGHQRTRDENALLFPSAKDAQRPVDIRKAWETALRRAEITNFRFHDLRHTAASYLAMDGASAPEIAEILGHRSLQMVKRYSHFNKAHIAKILTRMNRSRLESQDPEPNSKET